MATKVVLVLFPQSIFLFILYNCLVTGFQQNSVAGPHRNAVSTTVQALQETLGIFTGCFQTENNN